MNSRPTIADVAAAAHVSISTVDRVLSGRHAVRKATAQQVLEAAQAIGFYGTEAMRQRLRQDRPQRAFGLLLQQQRRTLYQMIGTALKESVEAASAVRGRAVLEYRDDLSPELTS